ncbi:MAG TPA: glycosyltransferase [Gemmatimonadales bacterium]|nr:glycosyltransferase [Gemmatimonadales bacterium]
MTRVLVVAAYDDALNAHSAQRERALERHGQTVTRFDVSARPGLLSRLRGGDLVSRLDRELEVGAPDVVLVVRGEALSAQAVTTLRRAHPGTWVNWIPDDLHGLAIVQHALPAYDLVFASGTDVQEALAGQLEKPVHYLPLAADPSVYKPMRSRDQYRANVVFAGTATPRRERLLAELVEFGLAVWGPGWRRTSLRDYCRGEQLDTENFVRAYAGASVAVNIHRSADAEPAVVERGVNQRTFEVAAIGVPQVVDYRADLEQHFEDRKELLVYRSVDEMRALVEAALQDPSAAEAVASAGRARVLREHTYMHRMHALLEVVRRSH